MVSASFVQVDFRGGEWSPLAQGRIADPAYKTGNNVMYNAIPLEAGAWVRRSGARFLAHTRGGTLAALLGFDFSVEQPYVLELTDNFVRFYAGLDLLTWEAAEGPVNVSGVLPTNPATIVLNSVVPAGWANGATIVYKSNSVPAMSTDVLGRQFVVANLDTSARTFTLKDPITGLDVDGSAWIVTPNTGSTPDTVERIFELATPYGQEHVQLVLAVQDDDNVLLIHHTYKPQLISAPADGSAPFAIAPQDFKDGPYLDIPKDTTTTLSLSGLTGSVTVTASGTTDINDGDGFLATDVGRLIRFQGGPAAWDSGTTYAKQAIVLGSDNNIYTSLTGGNLNNDPTTDNTGTNWEISPTTIFWTWLKITARASTTSVTATIMGGDLPQAAATTQWQLGLYSDTTGWPAVGTYHEGRLWLAGAAMGFTNRVDGSVSNDPFNFAPTAADGTVSDANAVAAIFRAKEANVIFWMISTDDGLMLGTQAGEWRIKASVLDDPISDTSIQARRVSTYGCANMQPVQPGGQTVFMQRQQRRMLAHQQQTANRYFAANLTQNADHVTESGIQEIMWQQEPNLCIWARRNDGSLVGCTYQERQYSGFAVAKEPFNGFHRHDLGNPAKPRNVTSIQSSPSYNGLSDALYMVTNQAHPSEPDKGVYWVQVLMPVFDSTIEDWGAYFTDGGSNPPYAQLFQTINGDAFDGITIYGLWPLNGQTIAPVLGGLDLGDHTVANGSVSVSFGSDPAGTFTLAFFLALSNGTDYSIFGVRTGSVVTGSPTNPDIPANNLVGFVGPDANVLGSRSNCAHIDRTNNRLLELILPPNATPGYGGGLRLIDTDDSSGTFGDEILQHDNQDIFGAATSLGAWDSGTTYNAGDVVTGSDTVHYRSNAGGNVGHNPVGDAGVHWSPRAAVAGISVDISYLHADGFMYQTGTRGDSNSSSMSKINATTLVETASYGANNGTLDRSTTGRLARAVNSMTGLRISQGDGTFNNFLIYVGLWNTFHANEVAVLQTDGSMTFKVSILTDEESASVTRGPTESSFFAAGFPYAAFPGLWLVGTTYGDGDTVYGSDGQMYISTEGSNVGNDPTTDHVNWNVTAQAVGLYQFQYDNGSGTLAARSIKKIGPKDIDSTWTTMEAVVGPATDGRDILMLVQTGDTVTNKRYFAKFSAVDGHLIWKVALPASIVAFADLQSMSVADFACTGVLAHAESSTVYIVDMATGNLTTQAINSGFSDFTTHQYYDCASGSVTAFISYTPGSGPTMTYLGSYLPANGDSLSSQWGRFYVGLACCGEQTVTTYNVPMSLGCSYTSQGQLLRPDFGNDAGARNGPAFGKKRRVHWYAAEFDRSRGVSIGTDFNKMHPVPMKSDGGIPPAAPVLFSGIATETIENDYSFYGEIAWQVTRPYPCNITAISGYIEGMDK